MKDAFGGAFMIKLILVFLTVYIAFMAVALNYAKAFRVKNQIINLIEQYEGYYENGEFKDTNVKELIDNYVARLNYHVNFTSLKNTISGSENCADDENCMTRSRECSEFGYCITTVKTGAGAYYIVETYVELEMPFKLPFRHIALTIPVRGETKVIKNLLD